MARTRADSEKRIRSYMNAERPQESIVSMERYRQQRVAETDYEVWDLQTDERRYWIVLPPIRYYPQHSFPSLDFAFTFHIGAAMQILEQPVPDAPTEEAFDRAGETWRRLAQTREDVRAAEEIEDFQAVGMKLREVLITVAHEFADSDLLPEGRDPPKKSDFKEWASVVADEFAPGKSGHDIRSYLKNTAKLVWDLVNWLTHSRDASRARAEIAVEATAHAIVVLVEAWVHILRDAPLQCPKCNSYKLSSEHRPDLDEGEPYITYCESCGWRDTSADDPTIDTDKWYRCDHCGRLHPVTDLVLSYKEDPLKQPTLVARIRDSLTRRRS